MSPSDGEGPTGSDLIGLGVFLAGVVVVPLVVGALVDGVLRTSPLFILVGLFLGIIGAVAVFYTRFVRRYT